MRFYVRRGLSLVEVIVASVLASMVVVAALETLGQSLRSQRFASELIDGPLLAESLLAEIMALPYVDPETKTAAIGRDNGEPTARSGFDDVDDYNNWSEASLHTKNGTTLPRYAGWSRTAIVQWADAGAGNRWTLFDSGLKRIRVQVTSPAGTVTQRWGYRWKQGTLQTQGATDIQAVTQLQSALRVGTSTSAAIRTTTLLNHVQQPGN